MRRLMYCLLLVPLLSLIASCDTQEQKQKDDRVTGAFESFAHRTEERLKAGALLIASHSGGLSEIPGGSQPSVEVTYDVKRSTSTIAPDAYSATLTVTLQSDEQTSSVTAEYTFADGKWSTSKIGDTRQIEQHLDKLEEQFRAYRREVADDTPGEEEPVVEMVEMLFGTFRQIHEVLEYSDGGSEPTGK